jgi:large subunit ribosomal protein L9
MKLILLEDIRNLGKTGEQVTVKDGYGRNYLVPRSLALLATPANLQVFANERKALDKRQSRLRSDAQAKVDKLSAQVVTIVRLAGEGDKMFGSVTNADIAEFLKAAGFEVDKRRILLAEPIKSLGTFEVAIDLYQHIQAKVKVEVIRQPTHSQEEETAAAQAQEGETAQA